MANVRALNTAAVFQIKFLSSYLSLAWRQITNCFRDEDRGHGEQWHRTAERDRELCLEQISAPVGTAVLATQHRPFNGSLSGKTRWAGTRTLRNIK